MSTILSTNQNGAYRLTSPYLIFIFHRSRRSRAEEKVLKKILLLNM